MPMMFAMPCHPCHPMHVGRTRRTPSSPSVAPCGGVLDILFIIALVLLAPTIIRVAFVLFLNIAMFAIHIAIASVLIKACTTLYDGELTSWGCCATKMPGCVRPEQKMAAKMKAAGPCASTVREALAKEVTSPIHRDWSSVSVDKGDEQIRLVVSVPGVKASDIDVSVVDDVLTVKGASERGFCVDRQFVCPGAADLDTASCTHEDGVLTITVQRKATHHIPIVTSPAAVERGTDTASMAAEAAAASKLQSATQDVVQEPFGHEAAGGACSSEDEWVPLSAAPAEKSNVAKKE